MTQEGVLESIDRIGPLQKAEQTGTNEAFRLATSGRITALDDLTALS